MLIFTHKKAASGIHRMPLFLLLNYLLLAGERVNNTQVKATKAPAKDK